MKKSKIAGLLWKAVSVTIYASAAFFPQYPELTDVAGVYAWVMITLINLLMLSIMAIIYGQSIDNKDISDKAKAAFSQLKQDKPNYGFISWALLIFSIACMAWAGLTVTAFTYAIASLALRFGVPVALK